MNLTNPGNSRPQYYDRAPLNTSCTYAASAVAPHANTQRALYTVPANRKAFVGAVFDEIMRDTATGTPSTVSANVGVTPSGGSRVLVVDVHFLLGTLGAQVITNAGGNVVLSAGDVLDIKTADGSTGGTMFYALTGMVTEFDA